jgi:hypothetical protein
MEALDNLVDIAGGLKADPRFGAFMMDLLDLCCCISRMNETLVLCKLDLFFDAGLVVKDDFRVASPLHGAVLDPKPTPTLLLEELVLRIVTTMVQRMKELLVVSLNGCRMVRYEREDRD